MKLMRECKGLSDEQISKDGIWERAGRQIQESLNVAQLKREELVRDGWLTSF